MTGMGILGALGTRPRRRRRRRHPPVELSARQVLVAVARAAALAALASAGAWLLLAFYQYRVPFPQLWAVFTAVLLLRWIVWSTHGPPLAPQAGPDPSAAELRGQPFAQAKRWERRLSVTAGDPQWFARVVRDRVSTVVAQRLRQRHGVALAGDPGRARAILGDELYGFVAAPLPRTPTPAELDRLITRIEEI